MTKRWGILQGDCIERLKQLPDNSIDAVVTDPPYELGFMGKKWDATGIAYSVELWTEVLRVLKPGAHLLAFGGTRTYHRMACAIEDAGFEVRDCLQWLYGTGFPKSLDVSKAIDKDAGHWRGKSPGVVSENVAMGGPNYARVPKGDPVTAAAAAWEGWGTALKPANEPIVMARKPISGTVAANVQQWGTGALNIDVSRVGDEVLPAAAAGQTSIWGSERHSIVSAVTPERIGRWPANVILDEDAAAELDVQSNASRFFYVAKPARSERDLGCEDLPSKSAGEATAREEDTDGLNSPRAGAGRTGGAKNHHPTVKPVALMRYLVRMITPPAGIVLDPFTGSGTTGMATVAEGFRFIGFEREPEYVQIASSRIAAYEKVSNDD